MIITLTQDAPRISVVDESFRLALLPNSECWPWPWPCQGSALRLLEHPPERKKYAEQDEDSEEDGEVSR